MVAVPYNNQWLWSETASLEDYIQGDNYYFAYNGVSGKIKEYDRREYVFSYLCIGYRQN